MTEPFAISFTLPGVPRGWARARKNGRRFFKDHETEAFQTALGTAAHAQMRGQEPFSGPVELTVTSIFPVPKSWSASKRARALAGELRPICRPDADNLIKQSDALNGVVWRDDAQVVDARSIKFYGERPAMHVTVKAIQQPQSLGRPGGTSAYNGSGVIQQEARAGGP